MKDLLALRDRFMNELTGMVVEQEVLMKAKVRIITWDDPEKDLFLARVTVEGETVASLVLNYHTGTITRS
jgi:hypothetical protein